MHIYVILICFLHCLIQAFCVFHQPLFSHSKSSSKDLKTTNVDFVYQAMKDWKIKQTGFKSKAEKFSKEDIEKMIELLLNRGVIK